MTHVYYGFFYEPLPTAIYHEKVRLLSTDQASKIQRFKRWQDAHASLYGKLLLQKGFDAFCITEKLSDLLLTPNGKPCLMDNPLHFNISHSGNCVVCVLSTDTTDIGIDVEEIKDINIQDFRDIWNEEEWKCISYGGVKSFYRFWTSKEAIIKADGKGLQIPLKEIIVKDTYGIYGNLTFFLKEIKVHPDYMMHIASTSSIEQMKIILVQDFHII